MIIGPRQHLDLTMQVEHKGAFKRLEGDFLGRKTASKEESAANRRRERTETRSDL